MTSWLERFSRTAARSIYAQRGHVEEAEQRLSDRVEHLERRVAELERDRSA